MVEKNKYLLGDDYVLIGCIPYIILGAEGYAFYGSQAVGPKSLPIVIGNHINPRAVVFPVVGSSEGEVLEGMVAIDETFFKKNCKPLTDIVSRERFLCDLKQKNITKNK